MNLFLPAEIVKNYGDTGKKKAGLSVMSMLFLGFLAGILIALGSATTNTAAFAIENTSVAKIICGLLFPFGLGMVMVIGAELFTGNCLMVISILEKKITIKGMAKSLTFVYLGNFIGALCVAISCVVFGQLSMSGGDLAVYTAKVASTKASLSFIPALGLGIFCNILVALGVLMSLSAKDIPGKIMGAFLPVTFFIICGFEHCIANMYYIPAGIFAANSPMYAAKIAEAGINVSALTWGNFLFNNLIPVTIGNIIGGAGLGLVLWMGHIFPHRKEAL